MKTGFILGEPMLETLKGPPPFFARPTWEANQKSAQWKKAKTFAAQLGMLHKATGQISTSTAINPRGLKAQVASQKTVKPMMKMKTTRLQPAGYRP